MKIEERFERILKDLDRCAQVVRRGALAHRDFDSKVDAYRLKTKLERCRASLRVEVFAFEDAVRALPRVESLEIA